jgi:hypothetical protein
MQNAHWLKWPVLRGHLTNNTPKWPPGVHPAGTLKHQEATHTILFYKRPPSNHHTYIMQSHIVYIPNLFVRLMLSLYSNYFVLMGHPSRRQAFSGVPPGGRPDLRLVRILYARM